MDLNKKKTNGLGFYIALVIVVVAVYMLFRVANITGGDYNLANFKEDLQDGKKDNGTDSLFPYFL